MLTFSALGRLGRLGNQMFQYAALIGVSLRTGFDYGVDYDVFEIPAAFEVTPGKHPDGKVRPVYRERHHHYDEGAFGVADDTDLFGYFQSEKYFAHCPDAIRREFTFKAGIRVKCSRLLAGLREPGGELVSVHVRRGDYLRIPGVPICPAEYYLRAMLQLARRGRCKFLVFSDDPGWCRENIEGAEVQVVQTGSDCEDLCLMSLCDHHIIANSSFSWWGAWLNPRPAKVIIAPRAWFGPTDPPLSTQDLYCPGWVRL